MRADYLYLNPLTRKSCCVIRFSRMPQPRAQIWPLSTHLYSTLLSHSHRVSGQCFYMKHKNQLCVWWYCCALTLFSAERDLGPDNTAGASQPLGDKEGWPSIQQEKKIIKLLLIKWKRVTNWIGDVYFFCKTPAWCQPFLQEVIFHLDF